MEARAAFATHLTQLSREGGGGGGEGGKEAREGGRRGEGKDGRGERGGRGEKGERGGDDHAPLVLTAIVPLLSLTRSSLLSLLSTATADCITRLRGLDRAQREAGEGFRVSARGVGGYGEVEEAGAGIRQR